ncbi:MAG: DUF2218 domain-containing protein [Roseibium sp.]
MLVATTTVQTASASKYLQQLCKHFAHKVPAKWDTEQGEVTFPAGFCRMDAASDRLTIRCEADEDRKISQMKSIIDNHIERFAWREKLKLRWLPVTAQKTD